MSDEPADAPPPARPRHVLPLVLTGLASLIAFLVIFSLWANRQFLDTEAWTDTSTKVLQEPPVRKQVSLFLVDQLYTYVDVEGELRQVLPPRAQPLASTAAGALRQLAERAAYELLGRPRVETAWEEANRRAHRRLLQVLEGGGDVVSTDKGRVTLDLKALLGQTASRVGVGNRAQQKLPDDAAQITILRSDQLGLAQDVLQAIKTVPVVLIVLMLALYALAVYLGRGRRREVLRACGLGLMAAGVLALLVRSLAGHSLVDSLAGTEAVRPAIQATWDLTTTLLDEAATATIFYGVVIVLGTWLAGPTGAAVWTRGRLAPFMREPRWAYGIFGVLVVLLVAWGPTPALRKPGTVVILVALLALGMEALRRQTVREFPEASLEELWRHTREGLGRMVDRTRGGRGPGRGAPDRLAELERLNALRTSGALDPAEFEQEKRRILDGPLPSP